MATRRSIWRQDANLSISFSRDIADRTKGSQKWEISILREHCKDKDVEEFYKAYMRRLHMNQLYSFLTMLVLNTCIHSGLLLATLSPLERREIYIDVCIYIGATILTIIIFVISIKTNSHKSYMSVPNLTTLVVLIILIGMDVSVPLLHTYRRTITLPVYMNFIVFSIYCFFPIASDVYAVCLGILSSAFYMAFLKIQVYFWIQQGSKSFDYTKGTSKYIAIAAMNLFGIFMRFTREILTRMTFLDKRQCIEEDLLFHAAKDQEKSLLLSMIPAQIAKQMEEDVKLRIEIMKNPASANSLEKIRKLFIEPHDDVTILYADIVNYTKLTTTLDAKTLVETLHELFVRFDDAAKEFDVLRIQFLGDCYYCVANVSMPNEDHAKACVKLGLRMINDIRDVGENRNLGIDMRIGVHSGSVLSGVIGATKWQFDIYSKDVEIANRLESTGVPGRVHISKETLERLDKRFKFEPGTQAARFDPLLRKHQITTFLIITPELDETSQMVRRSIFVRGFSTDEGLEEMDSFQKMKTLVHTEMGQESSKFPIFGLVQQYKKIILGQYTRTRRSEGAKTNFYANISWLFMCYKNWRWEYNYIQQSDILHKYSVLIAMLVTWGIVLIQYFNGVQSVLFWNTALFGNLIILLTFCFVWYRRAWSWFCSSTLLAGPSHHVSHWLFVLSDKAQRNFKFRTVVYFLIVLLGFCLVTFQMLDCNQFRVVNDVIETHAYQADINNICFVPWAVTDSLVILCGVIFLFTHVSYIFKWIIALTVTIFYIIVVFAVFDFLFEYSVSSNPYLFPEFAHLMVLCRTAWIFHIMNREIEFISRMDFNWKHELRKKKDDARFTNETISILVGNILPTHIVNIYMKDLLTSDVYYEEYENVAVMFATIRNYDTEQVGMRVLNEIICDFDEVLSNYQGIDKIEKIKVAGWTYMAACGLNATNTTARKNRMFISRSTSAMNLALSRSLFSNISAETLTIPNQDSLVLENDVVFVMLSFALDLLHKMRDFNEENVQSDDTKRSQGISNGPVMAGVVGLYKPFYDIWGNAVNMASRMDSTGLEDAIQVTEETAKILQAFNVQCTYRGQTYVKGRDYIPTYFVKIDDDLHFVQRPSQSNPTELNTETQ
ncbi:adenylyl cyclase X E-like isoform X2 [Zeugodacus cucurbitae]|uniref:adenylyl cyclase X E-like isoform X2 n=1 Tax=Zeugodacus cucurbitae TaxID=28588 RepID=UPI0023D92A3A|nr:adenylyl cyclase X E-like isoform X2 [Zeugodacus cucurbitae]